MLIFYGLEQNIVSGMIIEFNEEKIGNDYFVELWMVVLQSNVVI